MSEELQEQDLKQKFLQETDPKELQTIVDMFNLDIRKKNMLRMTRIGEIQDGIVNQISQRVQSRPDEFSNSDLINYFKVMQDALSKNLGDTELSEIHISQNNQVNINVESDDTTLNRMSRERVANAIRNILSQAQKLTSGPYDGIIDVNPEDIKLEDVPIDEPNELQ